MVIVEYTINHQFKGDPLKCNEAVKSYTTIGNFFFKVLINTSNSNLTSPTNKLRKNKKRRSTLIWQIVSRVVHGVGRVGFLSNPEGLESTRSLGSPRSGPCVDRYEESVQVDLLE